MKKLILIIGAVFALAFAVSPAEAGILQGNTVENMQNNANVVGFQAGYNQNTRLADVVALAIRAFLGLLGIIFVILMIIAGFNWMTAAGDEEKIKKATVTIRSAVIGLLIVVAAYAITYFVFANLPGASVS